MKIAYFDCVAGASGDMILGALLDAGLPEATLHERLAALHLDGFELNCYRVNKNGFDAVKVDVIVDDNVPARTLVDIEAIVMGSDLSLALKKQAVSIFRRLGEVEATIHGTTLEQIHLHELGGIDTIIDVVGTLVGLEVLGVEQVTASPLPMGRGFVGGAHGKIPLPAPATLALLKGTPIVGSDLDMELVTPTGAVLLSSLAEAFGPISTMTLTSVGYGAGARDLPIPNLLRVLLGDRPTTDQAIIETLVVLETNIDDLNPEFYDYVMGRLFDAGALDVYLSPIQMKKNRPATQLSVLCRPMDVDGLRNILFTETSTLGVRQQMVQRHRLNRSVHTVETPYGSVRVKMARLSEGQTKAYPEYEDCRRLAEAGGKTLREIYRAAEQAAEKLEPK